MNLEYRVFSKLILFNLNANEIPKRILSYLLNPFLLLRRDSFHSTFNKILINYRDRSFFTTIMLGVKFGEM